MIRQLIKKELQTTNNNIDINIIYKEIQIK